MTAWMNRFLIGTRIHGGFAVILVMLGILAIISYRSLAFISETQNRYAAFSGNALTVQKIERDLVGLRRNIYAYLTTGSLPEFKRAEELMKAIGGEFGELDHSLRDASLRQEVRALQKSVEAYFAMVKKAVETRESRDWILETGFQPNTDSASIILGRTIGAALTSGKAEVAAHLGLAQAAVWVVRYYTERLDVKGDPDDAQKAKEGLEALRRAVVDAQAKLDDPALQPRLDKVQQRVDDVAKTYDKLVEFIETYHQAADKTLPAQAEVFRQQSEALTAKMRATLKQLDQDVSGEIARTIHTTVVLSAVIFILGALFALVISRGISRPIIRMTRTMTALANGDNTVEIPSLDNRDEIGGMARALAIFKEHAIENEHLRETQEVEERKKRRRQEESE